MEQGSLSFKNYHDSVTFIKKETTPKDLDNHLVDKSISNVINKSNDNYSHFNSQLITLIKNNPRNTICISKPVKILYDKNISISSKPYPIQPLLFEQFKNKKTNY